jgi:multiple sugar transport system permease protein
MVPLGVTTSLLLAALLNQALKGTSLYRTVFFLPSLVPAVAAAIVWRAVLQKDVGVVNHVLGLVGVRGPSWMGTVEWAIPAILLIALWQNAGGNRMIIFLAGLQGVPQELYEAAEIDGAGRLARFQHVTLPMISPAIFFNLILGVIGALKVFTIAFVATKGGPAYATWFFALHIYTQAFEYFNLGYAAALSWVFFFIMFVFTFVQFQASRRWVYYSGEDRS